MRLGKARHGWARQFWFVRFRSVAVCSGVVRQLGRVRVGLGAVRFGLVGNGSHGELRHVKAWFGQALYGSYGKASYGKSWLGKVGRVEVWSGMARQFW